MTDRVPNANFGDVVENGWASEDNPTRRGYFVRSFNRRGRMNAGLTWEITDGRGKFWELSPVGDHRIVVTPADRLEALTGGEVASSALHPPPPSDTGGAG